MTLPRRLRILSLLMLLLVTGPLAAATSRRQSQGAGPSRLSITGALSEAWAFVSRIWTKEGGSTDPFGKEGSGSDPFGKAGGGVDPFGNPSPNALAPSYGSPTESQPTPGQ
jgi:hypothetical protein